MCTVAGCSDGGPLDAAATEKAQGGHKEGRRSVVAKGSQRWWRQVERCSNKGHSLPRPIASALNPTRCRAQGTAKTKDSGVTDEVGIALREAAVKAGLVSKTMPVNPTATKPSKGDPTTKLIDRILRPE